VAKERGLQGRLKHFTGTPDLSSLDVTFAGRGGAVSGLQRRRFIVPGGSVITFQVAGACGGQGRPGEGRPRHRADFLCLLLLGSIPPGLASLALVWVGNRKPSPLVNIIRTDILDFSS
jgi:hypothetical protein